jgi:hypothetical protein
MAKKVGFIGLGYENLASVARKTQLSSVHVNNLKNAWIKWLHPKGGGALTKKVANDLTSYMRQAIWSQEAFRGMTALSDTWRDWKEEHGLDPRIGIATGAMVEAIRPINQGSGKWKVGISKEAQVGPGRQRVTSRETGMTSKVGNIKNIATYAKILETGYGPVTVRGRTYYQPPRPFFITTFTRWAKEKLPDEIFQTIWKEMQPPMDKLWKEMEASRPRFSPEDLYSTAMDPEEDTADEVSREVRAEFGEQQERGREYMGTEAEGTQAPSVERGRGWSPGDVGDPEEKTVPGYSPEARTEEYTVGKKGLLFTVPSGDVWNENDQMWQDVETAWRRGVF